MRARYTLEIPYWRRKQLQCQGLAMPLELDGEKMEYLYWVDVHYDPVIGLQLPKTALREEKRTEIF